MVMQMLHAGGMPIYDAKGPAFECGRILGLPDDSDWVKDARGQAVKFLDPHIFTPPPDLEYRFIWLTRDHEQQAKSMVKFGNLLGTIVDPNQWPVLAESFKVDEPKALAILEELSQGRILKLNFESILEGSILTAQNLNQFCGYSLNPMNASGVVIPRPPEAIGGKLEMTLLGYY
ncbi:MAG: hypothetical protein GWM98_11645 [Nitrospinaceae bacterium]|nr:hypothetical protein [Nitrospinaceae bacterium]NIT82275.1 hypothetical protein [Nitrospinaceae bacterium]NIU96645.1 hypothetical protein [Nitrospinaceae bacterium]NIY15494.1 hypothetical protein [Nitrospinaceae bacterium]